MVLLVSYRQNIQIKCRFGMWFEIWYLIKFSSIDNTSSQKEYIMQKKLELKINFINIIHFRKTGNT